MKKTIVLLLLVVLFNSTATSAQTGAARADSAFKAAIDRYARTTMDKLPDLPAISIVVIRDDKAIFLKAYGMADREAGRKADVNTLFYNGSSTKSFTALVAAMLDQEGKIKFADPVTKYTVGISFKNPLPEKITVRDLLTHTSGLRNSPLVNRLAFTGQIESGDIDRVFAEATTLNDANFGKYAYTNLGYNIYGLILRYSLNKKWQDLLHERIFDPLGMKHTTAYVSWAPAKKWSVAAPYIMDPSAGQMIRSVLNKTDSNMQSAGGMFMSISDLGRWINMHMNGGKLRGKQVVPADIIRTVQTGYTKSTRNDPPFSSDGEYGLGWQIGKYRNEKVIYHHGGYPGYRSHVSFMPDKKIGVGVLVNNDQLGGRTADMLAVYAYDWWLNTENLEADYARQLQELVEAYEKRKQQVHAAAVERSKRAWQLTKALADYAGHYKNEIHGTIEIRPLQNALAVRMGNLNCIATPFTEKDTIRVEMLPGGSGDVIKFNMDAGGNLVSLTFGGVTFARQG